MRPGSQISKDPEFPGYSPDQNSKLNGVKNKHSRVEIAVSETESPKSAFARELMKLEIFPPGHAATRNIPSTRPGSGSQTYTKRKVAGRQQNELRQQSQ